MQYRKTLIRWWTQLRFRHQLLIAFSIFTFILLALNLVAIGKTANYVLMERGFSLLKATNNLSVKRFHERLQQISRNFSDCGPLAQKEWTEISSSKYFMGTENLLNSKSPKGGSIQIIQSDPHQSQISIRTSCIPNRNKESVLYLNALWLSDLFNDRTGLGESGETYLIYQNGQLVTESRFLNNPKAAPIPENIKDQWIGLKKDYRGISVLAVWTRVRLGDFNGFIASEIDEAEIMQSISKLFIISMAISVVILFLVFLILPLITTALSHNIERLKEMENVRNLALIQGQEDERHRMSMELHDDIGQRLTALAWKATTILSPDAANPITKDINDISSQVKALTRNLSTTILQNLGLHQALVQLVHQMQKSSIEVTCSIDISSESLQRLDTEMATAIYRIVQEGLTNMTKYSQSQTGLCHLFQKGRNLCLVIEDKGQGFSMENKSLGLGIKNMKTRVEACGGIFNIKSSPGKGVQIQCLFPIQREL